MSGELDHIAIAVERIDDAIRCFGTILSSKILAREVVESEEVEIALLQIGRARIELLSPLSNDSVVAKFIQRRGEGVHHIAITVADIEREIARLEEADVEMVDKEPRLGALGRRVAFIHPKSAHGVLIELVEHASDGEMSE